MMCWHFLMYQLILKMCKHEHVIFHRILQQMKKFKNLEWNYERSFYVARVCYVNRVDFSPSELKSLSTSPWLFFIATHELK